MGRLLSRILGRKEAPVEARSGLYSPPGYAEVFGIQPAASGAYVSPVMAENLATVLACVNVISGTMAAMTPRVYRATAAGREELRDHPVARLTRRPNADQTWPDWLEWTLAQVLLHGNAVSAIEHDGAGRPVALQPLPWGTVQLCRLSSGRLAYDVVQGTGGVRRLFADEVFHLRDRSDDGLIGRSRISRAREVLGNALALQEWSGSMWANQATPSGAITVPKNISPEGFKTFKAQFEQAHIGARNGRRVLFLDEGSQFLPFSISPEDAEVLASRRFTAEELARLFSVPPPVVGDLAHGTFTNSREAGRWFAQFTLAPWARKIEAEFRRSVFGAGSPDCTLEIDLSDLLRGDAEARWQSHKIAVESGVLDPNEIREVEGWNPRPAQPGMVG